MFCQQCGAPGLDQSKFCKQCGHKLREARISNKALILAAIAAVISTGAALLDFLPRNKPIKAQETPTPLVVLISPTPQVFPSPQQTRRPKPTPQKPDPTPTPDYLPRHTPTLESPSDGNVFSYHYSKGRIVFRWRPTAASEADRYKVTILHGNNHQRDIETPWNYCTADFVCVRLDDCSVKWRVTPIFADGRSGIPTEWRSFRFVQ